MNPASLSWLKLLDISFKGRRWFFPALCSWIPLQTITEDLHSLECRDWKKIDKSFRLGWYSIIAFEKTAENRFSVDSYKLSKYIQFLPHFGASEGNFHPKCFKTWALKCTRREIIQTEIWQARNTISGTVIGSRKREEKSGLGRKNNEVGKAVSWGTERPARPWHRVMCLYYKNTPMVSSKNQRSCS